MPGEPMLKVIAAAVVTAGVIAGGAAAHPPSRPQLIELAPGEAKGCYYYRGERRCGRYCYWEVNGKRYCQRRARDAVPQAEFYIEDQEQSGHRRSMK